jgi:hypothetical protein
VNLLDDVNHADYYQQLLVPFEAVVLQGCLSPTLTSMDSVQEPFQEVSKSFSLRVTQPKLKERRYTTIESCE